jgi:membrane protein YdbS with pleckstrin-like domain
MNRGLYEKIRNSALVILKAPAEPQPPVGNPASLRVFRAGHNYLRLRIASWAIVELIALGGLIFWTAFLIDIGGRVREEKEARANRKANASAPALNSANKDDSAKAPGEAAALQNNWKQRMKDDLRAAAAETKAAGKARKGKHVNWWAGFRHACVEFALRLPAGAFALIWAVKIFSTLLYLVQLPITYAVRRLDYEMRWYMVTDRSLRLRHGVWQISESTMSFANIQQVMVSQGPLQRLLGLGNVKVKSAGGGGVSDHHGHHEGDDMHTGVFQSVTNGQEIRDLIVERLRHFREAGLGDPDEITSSFAEPAGAVSGPVPSDALAAARELAAEAKALRAALG